MNSTKLNKATPTMKKYHKTIAALNLLFLLGWLLVFIDGPIRYPMDGETFFTQFQHVEMWLFMAYVILYSFLMWLISKGNERIGVLLASIALYVPFLYYFTWEYIAEVIYCANFFCGNGYPPTVLSYISGGIVSFVPIVNVVFVLRVLQTKWSGGHAPESVS